jgi:hypothetical protein
VAYPLKVALLLGACNLLCMPVQVKAQSSASGVPAQSHAPMAPDRAAIPYAALPYFATASFLAQPGASILSHNTPPRPLEPAYVQPIPPDETPLPGVPGIRVTLPHRRYHIKLDPKTGEPHMPTDITAMAEVCNWPSGMTLPTTFQWHVTLEWNYPKYPTHHNIGALIYQGASPCHVDFGSQVRGGLLMVAVSTILKGHMVVGRAYAEIGGENPTHEMVLRAFPRTRFGLIASKIGMAESDFQQFMPACGDEPGGRPYMSRTNDVGIMQLNAPTGSVTSEDQIWDWRANVRRGMEELADKGRVTALASRYAPVRDRLPADASEQFACINLLRLCMGLTALDPPPALPLSDKSGSGILPTDPDVDHLRLSQYERDAIRRYNGGSEYAYNITLRPDTPYPLSIGWEIDPTRGGVRPTAGDPDYVVHVLRAHSGLTLPSPPQPKPKAIGKPTGRKSAHPHRQRKSRTK